MTSRRLDLLTPLATARELISDPHLDIRRTLQMLHELPADIGHEARESVDYALRLVSDVVTGGSSIEVIARYALARAIVTLEREES